MTTLLYVTPHAFRHARLPTRPALLLEALAATGAFSSLVVVNRVRPRAWLFGRHGAPPSWPGVRESRLVEHPFPFGSHERRWLRRIATSLPRPVVAWVADPMSARFLADVAPWATTVFDAYDAWDLSPLVDDGRRLAAVRAGYRTAAANAALVFANTAAMADRLRAMGARDVRLLPNAAPAVKPEAPDPSPYLVYVGRIHERMSTVLVAAAADAVPGAVVRLVGPVERMPDGWDTLVTRPNIVVEGPLTAPEARQRIGRSRGLLVPHPADPYTRSQDAMKAWDALSVGAPVLSTSVPPADSWPPELAIIADDPTDFAAGAVRIVAGELNGGREARLAFAAANGWDARARSAVSAIREVAP